MHEKGEPKNKAQGKIPKEFRLNPSRGMLAQLAGKIAEMHRPLSNGINAI